MRIALTFKMMALLSLVLLTRTTLAQDDEVRLAEKKYNAAVEAAKKEFVVALKAEQTRLTKAGDLDGALKIRDRITALEELKSSTDKVGTTAENKNVANKDETSIEKSFVGKFKMTANGSIVTTWEFREDHRAIENGRQMGTWAVDHDDVVITYQGQVKAYGTTTLHRVSGDSFEGKNTQTNGATYDWVLERLKK